MHLILVFLIIIARHLLHKSTNGLMKMASRILAVTLRQARELERQRVSLRNAEAIYRERVTEIQEGYESRPDYIFQGAENRKNARDRWGGKKRQDFSIDDEQYYEQLLCVGRLRGIR
jgi:hypothetical protein